MNDIRVASRYAKSLLLLSTEMDEVQRTFEDMQLINNTCEGSVELVNLLNSPIIKADKKQSILSELFGKNISEITAKFLNLLVAKKRESLLPDVSHQFIVQFKRYKNIEVARVTTAVPLSDEMRKGIPSLVKEAMGSDANVEFIEEVNPDLIGGLVLRLGDKRLDSSIKRRLTDLEREFSRNSYVKKF